jgi:L-rhamnonate dehydratase
MISPFLEEGDTDSMANQTIRQARASFVSSGGANYHDQGSDYSIDDHIATPMAKYPEYRESRRTFGEQ